MNPWADVDSWIRYPVSFVVPLLATLLVTPHAGRLARRIGVIDLPGGHKTHLEATPYLGGGAVAAGLLAIGALASGANGQLATILACGAMLALLGFLDDMRGVSPVVRFSYEATCGLALWLAGVRAGVFGEAWADLLVTIVWVVAVTNAVNLIDNMDGLAAGVTAASALGIFAIAARNGDFLVGSLALAVAGASLGFLRHNFPPARIFLGDAGSLLLGLLLAALTLMLDLPVGPALPRMLTAGLLLAVPLFDLAVVVAARTAGRRAMWRGGTDHTSHRLAAAGLSGRAVALVFAGTQAVCSVLAFAVYDEPSGVVAAASVVAAIAGVALLGVVVRMPAPAA